MKHTTEEYLAWIDEQESSDKLINALRLANRDVLEMKPIPNAANVGEYAVGYNEMLAMLQNNVTSRLDEVM